MSAQENFGVGILGVVTFGLNDFATSLIARGKKSRLSRRALDDIKKICIANARNIDPSETLIRQDSENFRLAIAQLEKIIDVSIINGWGD